MLLLEIQVLEDNKKLEQILKTELQMPTIQRATLKIAGFGKSNILHKQYSVSSAIW